MFWMFVDLEHSGINTMPEVKDIRNVPREAFVATCQFGYSHKTITNDLEFSVQQREKILQFSLGVDITASVQITSHQIQ